MATHKLKARGKTIATKHPKFAGYEPTSKPSVKIIKCIGFQKFRYIGEKRPGKKYQDKDFLQIALYHLSGKNVKVQIVCFDTENVNEIHPNGLVGRDCQCGVYTKSIPVSKSTQIIRIPYLRTERILTKKTKQDEGQGNNMQTVFKERADILPSPFREQCLKQSTESKKYDTTRVCFGVIVTVEETNMESLFCLSNVVQNASEKTMLKILKLSTQYVSAQEGGELDIFTSEDGPPITAGKCTVKVVVDHGDHAWCSPESTPRQEEILYKRVVTYKVPAYEPNPATDSVVRAALSLTCVQSGQTCEFEFCYEPGADSARRLATIHSNKPLRKRPYPAPEPVEEDIKYDNIKMRVKEKVRSRQNQEIGSTNDVLRPELAQNSQTIVLSNGHGPAITVSSNERDEIPLHQQEDIVLAKDLKTGEIVYIRTQQNPAPSDVVMLMPDQAQILSSGGLSSFLSDAPRAVAVPTSEWNMSMPSTAATTTTVIRTLDSVGHVRRPSSEQTVVKMVPTPRKKPKFVSPWIVGEPENTPLINGDISFTQPKTEVLQVSYPSTSNAVALLKQEPAEMGPPILTPARTLPISTDMTVGMSVNLPSGTLISSANLTSDTNLPSLGSFFNNSMFDESGTLLSSSVFEMVQPYMEKMEK